MATEKKLSKADQSLKNALAPNKPHGFVKEVADELFSGALAPLPTEHIQEIPLDRIRTSKYQVRSMGDVEYIARLAESIEAEGLVAPIIVRKLLESNNFEIVAGHHRVEACRLLGRDRIMCVVRSLSDSSAALALTVDNTIRKDLSDYDRFKHLEMLQSVQACKTQAALARAVGVSQPSISNLKSFAVFPVEAKALLDSGANVLGSFYAAQLKPYCETNPALVTEAIRLLVEKDPSTEKPRLIPSRAVQWIQSKLNHPVRDPALVKIELYHGDAKARLTVATGRAELQAPGLNLKAVEDLIRAHLSELLA